MAENLCVKIGGGVQKWDLIWKNPAPNKALSSATTVNVDTTQYDALFVYTKGHYSYADALARLIQIARSDVYFDIAQPRSNFVTFRSITVTDTAVTFGTTAGYRYYSDGGGAYSTNYAIPLKLYGVKKLKLGN